MLQLRSLTRLLARLSALGIVAAMGCENRYLYVPVTNASAQMAGKPAADVAIPPEAPRGDVRLATFGIAEVTPQGAPEGTFLRALHLRVILANNSEQPWTFDTREQRLDLDGRGESRAAYGSADLGTPPPLVVVPPGGKRTVDLFFPLPEDLARASKLPAFDAIWTVHTDTRVVTERTPFERLQIEPRRNVYAYDWAWWSPAYYYDPFYPSGAWFGVALPPAYIERPVIIRQPSVPGVPPARRVP